MFPRRPFRWRRSLVVARPFVGRPRILGAALVGGLGYALGRSRRQATPAPAVAGNASAGASGTGSGGDQVAELERLAALHSSGALTDEEFAAAKQKRLR